MNKQDYAAVRGWTFDVALPWWAEHGVDRVNGGFVEQVTLDGANANVAFKRTRVACRQIYVYSHAATLGWTDGDAIAANGVDYLLTKCWAGPDRGFVRRLTREGQILDPTQDLYDYAFVMFALAWRLKASGDSHMRLWLHRTLDIIESRLRHPREGFWHELPGEGWRQQNPHMHLTEALVAAWEATGDERFAIAARELVDLFRRRFYDPATGTMTEFYDDGLAPAPGPDGRIVEPGHLFEWAWILNACRQAFGLELEAEIRALAAFGERFGVDPDTGATWNQIDQRGVQLDRGSRTWPNTERLKGAVAMSELDGADPGPVFASATGLLLKRYFATRPAGLWIDAFDAGGRAAASTVPASTLYHIFLAFSEVLRTGVRLGAA